MFKTLAAKLGKKKKVDMKSEKLPDIGEIPEALNMMESDSEKNIKDLKKNEMNTIVTIYRDKKDVHLWICQNCETENLPSKDSCCVCYAKR